MLGNAKLKNFVFHFVFRSLNRNFVAMKLKRFFKGLGITLASLAVLLVVALAVVLHLLHSPSFQQRVLRQADDWLSQKLQTEVEIDSVDFSLWRGSVNLYGLNVADQQQRPLLRTDTISVAVDVWSLLSRKVEVTKVGIHGVDLLLLKPSKEEPGNWQFAIDAFKKDSSDYRTQTPPDDVEGRSKAVELNLGGVSLSRIHLQYNEKELALSGLEAKKRRREYVAELRDLSYDWEKTTKKGIKVNHHLHLPLLGLSLSRRGEGPLMVEVKGLRYRSDNHLPRKNSGRPKRGFFDVGHLDLTSDLSIQVEGLDVNEFKLADRPLRLRLISGTVTDSVTGIDLHDLRLNLTSKAGGLHLDSVVIRQGAHTQLLFDTAFVQLPDTASGRPFQFSTSTITGQTRLHDISRPFAPVLRGFQLPLQLSTKFSGSATELHFRGVRVRTQDKRFLVSADGDISGLERKELLNVHFRVHSMQARGTVKQQIINQFTVKKLMMKQLDALGTIGYKGDFAVKYKREEFRGVLTSVPGPIIFSFWIDEKQKYLSGSASSKGLELAQLFEAQKLGPVSFESDFKMDISKQRTRQMRRNKGGKLPIGSVSGSVLEASYKGVKVRNLQFDIKSDGAEALGHVHKPGKVAEIDCDFTFTSTEQGQQLKVQPHVRLFPSDPEKKQQRADQRAQKKQERAQRREERAQQRAERREERAQRREQRRQQRAEEKAARAERKAQQSVNQTEPEE